MGTQGLILGHSALAAHHRAPIWMGHHIEPQKSVAELGARECGLRRGLGLWGAFMLADEFCKEYDTERTHVLFFTAQLVTLMALHILP